MEIDIGQRKGNNILNLGSIIFFIWLGNVCNKIVVSGSACEGNPNQDKLLTTFIRYIPYRKKKMIGNDEITQQGNYSSNLLLHNKQKSVSNLVSNNNSFIIRSSESEVDKLSWVVPTWGPLHAYSQVVAEAGVTGRLLHSSPWHVNWLGVCVQMEPRHMASLGFLTSWRFLGSHTFIWWRPALAPNLKDSKCKLLLLKAEPGNWYSTLPLDKQSPSLPRFQGVGRDPTIQWQEYRIILLAVVVVGWCGSMFRQKA